MYTCMYMVYTCMYMYVHGVYMYVHIIYMVCTCTYMLCTRFIDVHTRIYQVLLINRAIDTAKTGSCLYKLPHVADPSDEIVEVLIQCMDWNIASRQTGIPEAELP